VQAAAKAGRISSWNAISVEPCCLTYLVFDSQYLYVAIGFTKQDPTISTNTGENAVTKA